MTKIQLRRDTAANWSTNNPTPSAGEPCFETDTGKLKIGDGSTKYNDLAYQGGGGDVTADGDNTFKGSNTFNKKIIAEKGIDSQKTIFSTGIICYGGIGSTDLYLGLPTAGSVPSVKSSQTNKNIVFNGIFNDGASITNCSWDFIGTGMKSGEDSSTLYDVVTKSPTNNEYMGHMAMPSDKYIDLELGATGTEYTAPADGLVYFNTQLATTEAWRSATIENKTGKYMNTGVDSLGSSVRVLLPVRKDDIFKIRYNSLNSETIVKFIYAVGSEPSS